MRRVSAVLSVDQARLSASGTACIQATLKPSVHFYRVLSICVHKFISVAV